jgi:hypothetical protein
MPIRRKRRAGAPDGERLSGSVQLYFYCGHLASQACHVALQASKFLLLAGVQFWNCSWQISLQDFWASWMPAIGRE